MISRLLFSLASASLLLVLSFVSLTSASQVSVELGPESAEVNKSVIFDASELVTAVQGEYVNYEWLLGDGNREHGVEVVHAYADAGEYTVSVTISDETGAQETFQQSIFVYKKSYALITNLSGEKERIQGWITAAREQGIYVKLVETVSTQTEFLEEEELKQQLVEHLSDLDEVNAIIVYTYGSSGLTVLTQFRETFAQKEIFYISDQNFSTLTNIARGVFKSLNASSIVLTRFEALWVLLETEDTESFIQILDDRGIGYTTVEDELHIRPWNFLSALVNIMIDRGVPSSTILLILMLPIIVTVVAFMKQVVGIDTLGVYTPSILALSFIALNLWFGLFIFISLIGIGILVRQVLHRYRLLYIPRMAIVLTFTSLTILLLIFLGSIFNIGNVTGAAIFPMLIMSTMVEKFVAVQSDRGARGAIKVVAEVLLVVLLCFFVAEWDFLKVVVLGYPEVVLFFLAFNFLLARWTGLRLTEYFRFRELIHHIEE